MGLGTWSVVALTLLASPPARTERAPSLKRAIALFNDGNDRRAEREFQALLDRQPSDAEAGKVHLYLGLLQLNAFHPEAARDEFSKALALSPTLELPYDATPKAGVLFRQARAALEQGVPPAEVAPAPAPAPVTPPPTAAPVVVVEQPTPEWVTAGPNHTVSITVGSVGLAGAIAGLVCLDLSKQQLSDARAAPDVGASTRGAKTSADEQYAAEWLLGVGGGLVGAGIVAFVIESLTHSATEGGKAASTALSLATEGVQF